MDPSKRKKIADMRTPYTHEIYFTKKIEVRLKGWQRARAELIMSNLHRMWNQYCEITKKSLDDGLGFIGRYDFDKYHYPSLKAANPVYSRVPAQARTDMFAHCWRAIKYHWIDKKTADFNMPFRSWAKRPISSYHFQREGLRFPQNDDGSLDLTRFWIPVLHEVRLKEVGYLKPEDVPYISSGRVCFDRGHGKWYICFKFTAPPDYFLRSRPKKFEQSSAVGIDLGVHYLMTVAESDERAYHVTYGGERNPASDWKVKLWYRKVERLQSIIGYKVNQNMRRYGYDPSIPNLKVHSRHIRPIYHSKNIDKLWARIRKYYAKIKHHREDAIKKIVNTIARMNYEFIAIENLDIAWMQTNNPHWVNRNLYRSIMGFARRWLIWKARDCYHIPLVEADVTFPSTKMCHRCGHKFDIPGNEDTYICPNCGLLINRDFNAAINLLHYGRNLCKDIFKVSNHSNCNSLSDLM